ncbi:MAG: hypothetical protein JSW20_05880 [Nitrospiraceae bacterium]|nr:MAG: hypothetical protein JSW20_05880 [Nitrospiraceae bacterium]
MSKRLFRNIFTAVVILVSSAAFSVTETKTSTWQEEFDIAGCNMVNTGRNQYFIMEPGFQLVLEEEDTKLHITVLDETKTIDGVVTRVIEEKEWENGKLFEISRNYFAMCEKTKDIFYFGEDVDYYEKGKVVKHDGAWLAGVDGNRAGLIMPGTPKLDMKYYQEIAPGVAMDRAEIVSLDETCKTPAGTFSKCLKIKEGTSLNIVETEYKYYAPGIGLVADEDLRLIKHGFIKD